MTNGICERGILDLVQSNNFLDMFYGQLLNKTRVQILESAMKTSCSELRNAAMECATSLLYATPYSVIRRNVSFIFLMSNQLKELFIGHRLESNSFDNCQLAFSLHTVKRLYTILSQIFSHELTNYEPEVVQDLRFHVQYVLPETSEYVEELVTHPSSMVVSVAEGLIQERDMFTSNLNI